MLRGLPRRCTAAARSPSSCRPANRGYASACNAGAAVAAGAGAWRCSTPTWCRPRAGWLDPLLASRLGCRRPAARRRSGRSCCSRTAPSSTPACSSSRAGTASGYNNHYWKGFPRFHPAAHAGRAGAGRHRRRCSASAATPSKPLGGLCTDYMVGDYEDSDLCLRLRAAGRRDRLRAGRGALPLRAAVHPRPRRLRPHPGRAPTTASCTTRAGRRAIEALMARFSADAAGRAGRLKRCASSSSATTTPTSSPAALEVLRARPVPRAARPPRRGGPVPRRRHRARTAPRRPGTLAAGRRGGAADEMLVWLGHFDRFALSQPDTYGLASLAPLVAQPGPGHRPPAPPRCCSAPRRWT